MRQYALSKQDIHTVIANLGSKKDGNDIDDFRALRKGRDALREFCADYVSQLDELQSAARQARDDAEDAEELTEARVATINRRHARAVRALNESLGDDEVTVTIEDALHDSIRDRWKALSGWPGNEEVQDQILRITDAIDGARSVKLVDGEYQPVEKGEAEEKLRDFALNRKQRRAQKATSARP